MNMVITAVSSFMMMTAVFSMSEYDEKKMTVIFMIFAAKVSLTLKYKDCMLIEIGYAGDESTGATKQYAEDSHTGKAIRPVSIFQTGSDRQNTGMEPNKHYQIRLFVVMRQFGFRDIAEERSRISVSMPESRDS